MNAVFFVLTDVVAMGIVASLYVRRHHRRDLVVVLMALNIGVLALSHVLSSFPVGAGLGLGLFGVLSVVRLRADSLTQQEIGYFFVSLVLGVVAGLRPEPWWVVLVVAAGLVALLYLADHPGLLPRSRRLVVTLDAAIADEAALRARLEREIGGPVKQMYVRELDFVRDLTVVDVRFVMGPQPRVRQVQGEHWVAKPPHQGDSGRSPAGMDRWR